jgi:hypothetical protein
MDIFFNGGSKITESLSTELAAMRLVNSTRIVSPKVSVVAARLSATNSATVSI